MTVDITSNLIHHYACNDASGTTLADTGSSVKNGTLSGDATWGTGQFGGALHLPGSGGIVTTATSIGLSSLSAFTISYWIKLNTAGIVNYPCHFSFWNYDYTYNNRIEIHGGPSGSNRDIYCNVANGSGSYGIATNGIPALGEWCHIALVFDGAGSANSDKLKLYVNGYEHSLTFTGTIPSTTSAINTSTPLIIGGRIDGGIPGKQDYDDFRIYTRALTRGEVLAASCNGGPWIKYDVQETSGTTIADTGPYTEDSTVGSNISGNTITGPGGSLTSALSTDFLFPAGNIQVPSTTALRYDVGNELTLQFFGKHVVNNSETYTYDADINCALSVGDSGVSLTYYDSGDSLLLDTKSVSINGGWHHFALTFSAAGAVELFVDGTSAGFFTLPDNPVAYFIIYWFLAGDNGSSGICGIKVYPQVRSPSQIAADALIGGIAAGYRLSISDSGSFSLTGTTTGLRFNRLVSAANGSYTLSGTNANTLYNRKMPADSALFTTTMTTVYGLYSRVFTCASGSYTFTGTAANLFKDRTLVASSGVYTLSGTAASLLAQRKLTIDSGSYSLTAYNPLLSHGYTLHANSGSYTSTFSTAQLSTSHRDFGDISFVNIEWVLVHNVKHIVPQRTVYLILNDKVTDYAFDSSGLGYNATYYGFQGNEKWLGSAVSLTDDYYMLPAAPFNFSQDFSISCWVKSTADDYIIFSGRRNGQIALEVTNKRVTVDGSTLVFGS